MANVQTNWEDDDNNRRVELDVHYQLENGKLDIKSVTPTAVQFLCPQSGDVQRSVGVWTEKGQAFLVRRAIEAGRLTEIRRDLHRSHKVELDHSAENVATATENCQIGA